MLALPAFSYLKTVKYNKPPLSLTDQKNLLMSRGLAVNSDAALDKLLHDFGYARVDSYSEVFTLSGSSKFRPGTSYSQIWQVINLDEQLRNFLFPYTIRIELAVKAALTETLAQCGGSMGYLDPQLFHDQSHHSVWVKHVKCLWTKTLDKQSVAFRQRYDESEMPPVWYLTQILPLGSVSKAISNLKIPIAKQLMRSVGLPTHRAFRQSGLQGISVLRNFCAHGSRIWNYVFPLSFSVDEKIPNEFEKTRLAAAMALTELFLVKLDLGAEKFRTGRMQILESLPEWKLNRMGYLTKKEETLSILNTLSFEDD